MRRISRSAIPMLALAGLLIAACTPAATGVGGIGYTQRGATALVHAPVADVFEATRAVFQEMGIEMTDNGGRSARSNDIAVTGRRGSDEVLVGIERETNASSEVYVRVRQGAAAYNRELAAEILSRIVAKR